jgi:hypothetical protein
MSRNGALVGSVSLQAVWQKVLALPSVQSCGMKFWNTELELGVSWLFGTCCPSRVNSWTSATVIEVSTALKTDTSAKYLRRTEHTAQHRAASYSSIVYRSCQAVVVGLSGLLIWQPLCC